MCCPACPTPGASSSTATATATATSGKSKARKIAEPFAFGNVLAEQLKNRETPKPTFDERVVRKPDKR